MRILSMVCAALLCIVINSAPASAADVPAADAPITQPAAETLLPQRPQNFDPMKLSQQMAQEGTNVESQQHLATSSSMFGMYMTELSGYMSLLANYSKLIVFAMAMGGILFFFQLLYVRSNAAQTRRSVDMLKEAITSLEKSSRLCSRAYLSVHRYSGEWKGEAAEKRYELLAEIINNGKTPAYAVLVSLEVSGGLEIKPEGLNESYSEVLTPNAILSIRLHISQKTFEQSKMQKLHSKAEIRYKDAFAEEYLENVSLADIANPLAA